MAMTACAAKFAHQLDLLVGEGAHLLTIDNDGADQIGVLEHGHKQNGPNMPQLDAGNRVGIAIEIALLRREVDNVNNLLRLHHATKVRATGAQRRSSALLGQGWRRVMCNGEAEHLPIAQIHVSKVRFADAGCVREHGLEHRLQLAWRAELMTCSTSEVAVCCCSEFAQLVKQARILDGDDRLLGEIARQARSACR